MTELVNSGVVFNEEGHSYTLNGKTLKGITGLIKRVKFPNKYKDIPKDILEAAAIAGTKIHKSCQFADELGVIENEEAQAYVNYQSSIFCHPLANEYTVTDGEHWASNIDCVWEDPDNNIYLVDIKTTYEIDKEYLSWQLSIYAYLFEKQNPGLKVSGLFGVLLFKEGKTNMYGTRMMVHIDRKTDEEVEELLSHVNYEMEELPLPSVVNNEIFIPDETLQNIISFEKQMKELKEKEDFLKQNIKQTMEEAGVVSFKNEQITISLVAASTRESFDSRAFKKDHPELYKQYVKTSNVSSAIKIGIK